MASLTRNVIRPLVRGGTKQYSTLPPTLAHRVADSAKPKDGFETWKKVTLFLALPGCAAVFYKAMVLAPHPAPEEFLAYEHLRIRKKSFPWGDGNHTLFHTDEANVLPEGWLKVMAQARTITKFTGSNKLEGTKWMHMQPFNSVEITAYNDHWNQHLRLNAWQHCHSDNDDSERILHNLLWLHLDIT